ncbi:MAG: rhomboid family intramembrane serine protease [Bacteriovoracia bacterium]
MVSLFLGQMIADTFMGLHVLETLALVPYQFFERHAFWQLFTYSFVHGDFFHVLFNLLVLWMIGSELEAIWGWKSFLRYYLICSVSAGFFYLAVQIFFRGTSFQYVPLVGSSGAVYGLLTAYAILFSERMLLFMMVFPMKAKHFMLLLAAIEFISTVFYGRSGIANIAHIGGMIVGFFALFFQAWFRMRKRMPKKKKKGKGKLRLVVNNEVINEFDSDEDENKPTFH